MAKIENDEDSFFETVNFLEVEKRGLGSVYSFAKKLPFLG